MHRRHLLRIALVATIAWSLGIPSHGGDICSLPPDVGPCDGICPRWYFDPAIGDCELFDWGCCEGNANNFETYEACAKACGGGTPCFSDINDDGFVGVEDLVAVITHWLEAGGPADVNFDGIVNVVDLVQVLSDWGACGE